MYLVQFLKTLIAIVLLQQNNAACSQSLSKWIPAHFCCWSKQEAYNLSKINHKSTMDITKYSAGCIVDEGFI